MRHKRSKAIRNSKNKRRSTSKNKPRRRFRRSRGTLENIKVFAALSLARRERLSIEDAAKIEGTDLKTILRRAPSALQKRGRRYRVKQFDRIPAVMNLIGPKGPKTVIVRGSKSRSLVGRYLNAVKQYLYHGDDSALAEFRGKKVAGHTLITNLNKLRELADADLIAIDRVYGGITRGR